MLFLLHNKKFLVFVWINNVHNQHWKCSECAGKIHKKVAPVTFLDRGTTAREVRGRQKFLSLWNAFMVATFSPHYLSARTEASLTSTFASSWEPFWSAEHCLRCILLRKKLPPNLEAFVTSQFLTGGGSSSEAPRRLHWRCGLQSSEGLTGLQVLS